MRKTFVAFVVGALLGVAAPVAADYMDLLITSKLTDLENAVKKMSVQLFTIQQEVQGTRRDLKKLADAVEEEEQAWRKLKEAGK